MDSLDDPVVLTVCLTGGPCGGKTTSLAQLVPEFTARGVEVLCVPEVATLLLQGGCHFPAADDPDKLFAFELNLLRLQLEFERSFFANAKATGRSSLVLIDRGVCDVAAYVPQDMWAQLLHEVGLDEESALARYDIVIHLTSAARGAELAYQIARPPPGGMSVQDARSLDGSTMCAWEKHPRRTVVDNRTDFAGKVRRVLDAIMREMHALAPHAADWSNASSTRSCP